MKNLTLLLGVISKSFSLGCDTAILLLVLKNGLKETILYMVYIFYILKSPTNLITLAKFNDLRLD